MLAFFALPGCTLHGSAASRVAPSVDLANFMQVKQLALDHEFSCLPDGETDGHPMTLCSESTSTVLHFIIGPGLDGGAMVRSVGCSQSVMPTLQWGGDGFWIQLIIADRPTAAEQSVEAALGTPDLQCAQ
jgi:hypothetical protein